MLQAMNTFHATKKQKKGYIFRKKENRTTILRE